MFSRLASFFSASAEEEAQQITEEQQQTSTSTDKQPLIASALEEGGSGMAEVAENTADEVVAPADEESGEDEIVVETAPYDVRIPSQNQAKYCFTKYEEFYKCQGEKGEGSEECIPYKRAFRSFCPTEWVDQWEELRAEDRWYGKY